MKLVDLSVEESNKDSNKDLSRERLIAQFMESSASQLTPYGLEQLQNDIGEGEYAVFFRNNHFSVLHKHNKALYLLVTDQGYLYQQNIIWELFDSVDGDSLFVKADFSIYNPEENKPEGIVIANEIKEDEQLALQLQKEENEALKKAEEANRIAQEKADHEMALKLQQQENNNNNRVQQPPVPNISNPNVNPNMNPNMHGGNSNMNPNMNLNSGNSNNIHQDLYRAFQQGQPLTEDQLQQLNQYLGQQQNNENCLIM